MSEEQTIIGIDFGKRDRSAVCEIKDGKIVKFFLSDELCSDCKPDEVKWPHCDL